MKYCLRCYTANPDNQNRCINCDNLFFSATATGATEDVRTQILCSRCIQYISPAGFGCPYCGYPIEQSRDDARIKRHLRLTHTSAFEMILVDGDLIGRDFHGKLLLKKDLYVSATHIKVRQAGKYFELIDVSGGNSFLVNAAMVPVGGSRIVRDGDSVVIGLTKFSVTIF